MSVAPTRRDISCHTKVSHMGYRMYAIIITISRLIIGDEIALEIDCVVVGIKDPYSHNRTKGTWLVRILSCFQFC